VKTGGLNAEYGRLTGGAVNVLTKSGGNTFPRRYLRFGEGGGLRATTPPREAAPVVDQLSQHRHRADYGGDLGGYIVKDKVWFFGAFDRVDQRDEATILRPLAAPGSPAVGSAVPADIATYLFAAKGTFPLLAEPHADRHGVRRSTTRTGAIFTTANGQQSSSTDRPAPGRGRSIRAALIRSAATRRVLQHDAIERHVRQHARRTSTAARGARAFRSSSTTPSRRADVRRLHRVRQPELQAQRLKGDLTKYWGTHTIKTGADFEDISAVVDRFRGRVPASASTSSGRHRPESSTIAIGYYVNDQANRCSGRHQSRRLDDVLNPLTADACRRPERVVLRAGQLQRYSRTCR